MNHLPFEIIFEICTFLDRKTYFNVCNCNSLFYDNLFELKERRKQIFYNFYIEKVKNTWKNETTLQNIEKFKDQEDWYLLFLKDFLKFQKFKPYFTTHQFKDEVLHGRWSNDGNFISLASRDGSLSVYGSQEDIWISEFDIKATDCVVNFSQFSSNNENLTFSYLDTDFILRSRVYDILNSKWHTVPSSKFNNFPQWIEDEILVLVEDQPNGLYDDHLIFYDYKTKKSEKQTILFPVKHIYGIEDLLVSNDRNLIVFATGTSEKKNFHRNILKYLPVSLIKFEKPIKSDQLDTINLGSIAISQMAFTSDDKHLVVNLREIDPNTNLQIDDFEIRLIDNSSKTVIQKYRSHTCGEKKTGFLIYPHINNEYVLCGGQDHYIYIWNRKYGHLVAKIKHHKDIVNLVAWKPEKDEFLSVSDDQTAVIWKIPE